MKRSLSWKLVVTVLAALVVFAAEYLYLWVYQDYYFPGRYETAYGILVATAMLTVLALVLVLIIHFGGERGSSRHG